MKKLFFPIAIIMALISCGKEMKESKLDTSCADLQEEVEHLKIKLAATEAQLLNVQVELSKFRSTDTIASQKVD